MRFALIYCRAYNRNRAHTSIENSQDKAWRLLPTLMITAKRATRTLGYVPCLSRSDCVYLASVINQC